MLARVNTPRTRLILTTLVIVAATAALVWQQARVHRLAAEREEAQARLVEFEQLRAEAARLRTESPDPAELERLRAAESELKLEVARLRAELTEARRATTPTVPLADAGSPGAGAGETNTLSAGMKGIMRGAMEQQFQGQLNRMKEKLQLTPAQEEAVRAVHARQIAQAGAVAERMFSGKLTREEMSKLQGVAGNPEEEIRALLDPAQLERYTEYKQEEASSNARLIANAELLQMQGALGLSEAQQDQVFNALYDHSLNQLSGNVNAPVIQDPTGDPAAAFERVVAQKVEALSGVLTPEQLTAYRELQRQQMEMIKGILPAAGGEPAKP